MAAVEVHTTPGMQVHFRLALISILMCIYWKL